MINSKKTKTDTLSFEQDMTAEFFSAVLAAAVTSAVLALVWLIPVDRSLKRFEGIFLPNLFVSCRPEPLEVPSYVIAVVLVVLSFLGSYLLIKKHFKKYPLKLSNAAQFVCLSAVCIISVASAAFMCGVHPEYDTQFTLACFMLVPASAIMMFLFIAAEKRGSSRLSKVLYFSVLAVIFIYASIRLATMNLANQASLYRIHHYYAVWYPVERVGDGAVLGIDVNNIYGFYPYIVAALLKLFGGMNQSSAAVLFTILLDIVAVSYCAAAYKFINNKIIALVVSALCCIYGPFSFLGDNADGTLRMYLQYNPLRTVCVSVMLIALVLRCRIKSKKAGVAADIALCFISGLGMFWSFEFGAIAVLVWCAYRVFLAAAEHTVFSKEVLKSAAVSLIYAAVSFGLFIASVSAVTYVKSGKFLSLREMFFGISAFSGAGFNMVPITFGVWVVIAIVFAVSIMKVIPYLTKHKKLTEKLRGTVTGLFIISVTGIGCSVYFIKRSFPTIALLYLPFAIICCALLYEYNTEVYSVYEKGSVSSGRALCLMKKAMCVLLISSAVIPSISFLINSTTPEYNQSHYPNGQALDEINARAAAVKKWADKNNSGVLPNILLNNAVFVNDELGKKPYENVCDQIDWFFVDSAHTYIDFINEHSDESFVINDNAVYALKSAFKDEWKAIEKKFKCSKEYTDNYYDSYHIYTPKNKEKAG